jgi:hypothetical protein
MDRPQARSLLNDDFEMYEETSLVCHASPIGHGNGKAVVADISLDGAYVIVLPFSPAVPWLARCTTRSPEISAIVFAFVVGLKGRTQA